MSSTPSVPMTMLPWSASFHGFSAGAFLTVDVAIDKAWTASSFGYATHVWNDYITADPKVAPLAYRPRMVAVGCGYPILEDGKLIGGIGISAKVNMYF